MRPGRLILALLLIILGAVLLAANYGWMDWQFALSLGQLWPLILVILGIFFLLGRQRPALALVFMVVVVVAGVGLAWLSWTNGDNGVLAGQQTTTAITSSAASGVSRAEAHIDVGATQLVMKGGSTGALVDGSYRSLGKPEVSQTISGNTFNLSVKQMPGIRIHLPFGGGNREILDLSLGGGVPWSVFVNMGATKADVDLSEVNLEGFDLNAGASSITVRVGPQVEPGAKISLKGGAGSYHLLLPRSLNIGLTVDSGLSSRHLDSAFHKDSGNSYSYTGGGPSVNAEIKAGVSSITVELY